MMKKQKSLNKREPALTPRGEKESCDNCFKHPCYYHIRAGENSMIFCDNYEYCNFHISFGGDTIKKLDDKGLKHDRE